LGRYLDIVRGHEVTSSDGKCSAEDELSGTPYERNERNELIGGWGVAIAIDKLTGSALLMCSESDCQAVFSVADVYRPPFEIDLTDVQRKEIKQDIVFLEASERRRKRRSRQIGGEL
jgi:hypothetical protein